MVRGISGRCCVRVRTFGAPGIVVLFDYDCQYLYGTDDSASIMAAKFGSFVRCRSDGLLLVVADASSFSGVSGKL